MVDGGAEVYYFGRWGGPGHYLWSPSGRSSGHEVERRIPWPCAEFDGRLAGDPVLEDPRQRGHWATEHQPEGHARLHHRGGWTALSFWDRSGDQRHGSSSTLVARGEFTAAEMAALFERAFPAVWRRITARLQVELPAASVSDGAASVSDASCRA